jgi:catechol 2,3-dioxygenase-like lactoylglutathione lyase family enzyme
MAEQPPDTAPASLSDPMFDHLTLAVTDLDRARRFYDAALAPLGIVPQSVDGRSASYERHGCDDFTIIRSDTPPGAPHAAHVCFRAPGRAAVRAFHAAGLAAGGRDDGGPGLRPEYSPVYYAAFLSDPDGNRIEAVTRAAEDG